MPRMAQLLDYAMLCELAYVDWGPEGTALSATSMRDRAGREQALPPARAQDVLVSRGWRLAAPGVENDATGFGASLWQVGEAFGGHKVLALRGAEPTLRDGQLLDDLLDTAVGDIGLLGLALDQAVSLFNYLQRLCAPEGAHGVLQVDLRIGLAGPSAGTPVVEGPGARKYWLEARHDGAGLGALAPGESLRVTGHSLGGHLAALALRLFPDRAVEACAFNAPGFDPVSSLRLTDACVALFRPFQPALAGDWAAVSSRLEWVESEGSGPGDDIDLVTGAIAGRPPAAVLSVATETNSHGIDQLVDSLTLHALVELIDPGVAPGTFASLLAASSAQRANGAIAGLPAYPRNEDGHERLLAGLHQLIMGEPPVLARVAYSLIRAESFAGRESFHFAAIQLRDRLLAQPLEGARLVDLGAMTADQLQAAARGGPDALAYRHALVTLSPYALTGVPELFGPDRRRALALDIESAPGEAAFSAEYLRQRAHMLALALDLRTADQSVEVGGISGGPALRYADAVTGEVFTRSAAFAIGDARHVAFGRDLAGPGDRLVGGALADALFGLEGEDTLAGGAGADHLEGGRGADRYEALDDGDRVVDVEGDDDYFVTGPGTVRIEDADGRGRVFHQGTLLTGGRLGEDGVHRSLDGRAVYQPGADGGLHILLDGGRTRIEITAPDAARGALGLSLAGSAPGQAGTATGTPATEVLVVEADHWYIQRSGTRHRETVQAIYGGGGGDNLAVQPDIPGLVVFGDSGGRGPGVDGADFIELDRERKGARVQPTETANGAVVFGEGGDDWLLGSYRDDWMSGDEGHDALAGYWGHDRLFGGPANDMLDGRENDDALVGDEGHDLLLGAHGNDVLGGGEGNDTLFGDSMQPDVFAWRGATSTLSLRLGQPAALADVPAAAHGEDRLYGGVGRDWLYGGGGHDRLHGEDGGDWLLGEAGDDYLDGGEGDDELWGDYDPARRLADAQVLGTTLSYPLPNGIGVPVPFIWRSHAFAADAAGKDTLRGGPGQDTLHGGEGDDVYLFARGDGVDQVSDGAGEDTLVLLDIGSTDVELHRLGSTLLVERLEQGQGGTGDAVLVIDWTGAGRIERIAFGDGTLWGPEDIDRRLGGPAELIPPEPPGTLHRLGSAGTDQFFGGAGAEAYYALGGDDVVRGGGGEDRLFGGAGDDRLFGDNGDDLIDGGAGDDALHGGTGRDTLLGGTGDDLLYGHAGDDLLEGGPGADWLAGGAGHDLYGVDHPDDGLLEYAGEGIDTVESSVSFTLPAEVENLVLLGGGALEGGGNAAANLIRGNAGANRLAGEAGDDRLEGGAGEDCLLGGGGDDALEGGEGDDRLEGGDGADRLEGGEGRDTLLGAAGNDWLRGGQGTDRLEGGSGDDIYLFGRGDGQDAILDSQGGRDVLRFDRELSGTRFRFSRQGEDLRIALQGSPDSVTIERWFQGSAQRVERIELGAEGPALLAADVDRLINVAALFSRSSLFQAPSPFLARLLEAMPSLSASWQPVAA